MQQISEHALTSNTRRLTELSEAFGAAGRHELDEQQRAAAVDVAHQLVGSAGTFGYSRVSRSARRLERFFTEVEHPLGTMEELAVALVQMEQDLRNGPDDDD
jgi:HPt (histidine-containing phosphotransfer) domain-containing protein